MNDIMKLVGMMEARADWLKKEWTAGGNYEHLSTRRDETLYWLAKIAALSPSPETREKHD